MMWKSPGPFSSTKASLDSYLMVYIIGLSVLLGFTVSFGYPSLSLAETIEPLQKATGNPIPIGTVFPYVNGTLKGSLVIAGIYGIRIAFQHQNNYRNGIRGQPIELVVSNTTYDDPSKVIPLLDELYAQNGNMTSLIGIFGEQHSDEAIKWSAPKDITVIQPIVDASSYFTEFSTGHINMFASPEESLVGIIRYLVYYRRVKRIAFMSSPDTKQGSEIIPVVKRLCLEVGVQLHYLEVYSNASNVDFVSISKMFASKPQAIISWLLIEDIDAQTTAAVINLAGPDVIFAGNIGAMFLFGFLLRQLPKDFIGDRFLQALQAPLPTDTRFDVVRQFRKEATLAEKQGAYSVLGENPIMDMLTFLSYLVGRFAIQLHLDMPLQTKKQLHETLFNKKIITIEDTDFGPFSKECVGSFNIFCACQNGARIVYLGQFTGDSDAIIPIPGSDFQIPLGSCSKNILSLPAPLVFFIVYPTNEIGRNLSSAFELGEIAAIVSPSPIVQLVHNSTYTVGSNRLVETLDVDHMVTAVVGSVFDESVLWDNLTTIIDPFFETPVLNHGFQRQTIYTVQTLDQELFALAYHAANVAKADLRLLSAAPESVVMPIASALLKSQHTFGVSTGADATYVRSIQAGLDAINGDSGIIIVHGIKTEADVTAIVAALLRNPELYIALPMSHLESWYSKLLETVSNSIGKRIIFATSLPNWNLPGPSNAKKSAVLSSFFEKVPAPNRSPSSLRGFMTHRMLMTIARRTPEPITAAKFLDTLYMSIILPIDADLVVGPFYGDECTDTNSEKCETNIGARDISIRTLCSVLPSSSSHGPVSRMSFSSGKIPYLPLPTDNDITLYLVLGIVMSVLVVIVTVIVLIWYCTGRRNRWAPKNSDEPFTIVFTDIQSSTTLWSEVPEAMAPALDHHHAIIRELILAHKGYEVKTIGDSFMVAFHSASDAIQMAVAVQKRFFDDKTWPPEIDNAYKAKMSNAIVNEKLSISDDKYSEIWNGLRVRIGINTGFGDIKEERTGAYDYYGTVVNTAARVEAAGHGGQVLITRATYDAAIECTPGILNKVTELGNVELRGLSEPVEMLQVNAVDGRVFLPLRQDVVPGTEEFKEITKDTENCSASHSNSVASKLQKFSHVIALDFIKILFAVLGKDKISILKALCHKWRVRPITNTCVPGANIVIRSSLELTGFSEKIGMTDESIPFINALVGKLGPILHRKLTESGVIGTDFKIVGIASGDFRNQSYSDSCFGVDNSHAPRSMEFPFYPNHPHPLLSWNNSYDMLSYNSDMSIYSPVSYTR